jgi:GxxExxY protein
VYEFKLFLILVFFLLFLLIHSPNPIMMPQLFPHRPDNFKHSELTEIIIKAFYKVYNTLGYGFLEKVYERALECELSSYSLQIQRQQPINVFYYGIIVGKYFSDLIVEDVVIIEIKAAESLSHKHECQLINYLKATDKEVGLLLNFGSVPTFKRKVFLNENKL